MACYKINENISVLTDRTIQLKGISKGRGFTKEVNKIIPFNKVYQIYFENNESIFLIEVGTEIENIYVKATENDVYKMLDLLY